MPTYEYLCQSCSHRFETWQKMTDEPLTTCPECGQHIRRVLYPAGVIFKGSGFYKTDHSNKATLPASNGDTNKAASNGSTESTKSDAPKATESTSSETSTAKTTGSENNTARATAS